MSELKKVKLSRRGVERWANAHPWIYQSDVEAPKSLMGGEVVQVIDHRGFFLGQAFFSRESKISVRWLSWDDVPIDEGFFETMGVALIRGRGILASDTSEAPRVAVVNEHFAKHYWPNRDALGQHIRVNGRTGAPVKIVGIARTGSYRSTGEQPIDFVYLPLAQHPAARMVLLLRSSGDPQQLAKAAKDVVLALDPNMPMLELRTYEDLYRYSTVDGPAVAIGLVGVMGAVGLVLAVAGLYGLVSYNVARRTREIGIRMAIGAAPLDVLRLMMGKGVVLVGIGTAIGLALGFGVERLMNAMVFNAGGVDITAYAIVVPAMLLVTLLAAYVPARRASRIAPTQALRHE